MKTILEIGNCNADHMSLKSMLQSNFEATLLRAHGLSDALEALQTNNIDLVMINRLLDTDGSEGIAILRHLKADPDLQTIPAMLITNYAEHQDVAVTAGAIRGFGKAELRSNKTLQVIQTALGAV